MSLYDLVKQSHSTADSFWYNVTMLTRAKRQLISVQFELSPICNFSCPFCYVRKTENEMTRDGEQLLRFPFWAHILDQLAEMNVMRIGLTGGECMLHPDFLQIYRYAISKGFWVSLISNMSCMSNEIFNEFCLHHPHNVTVTMYGASKETYEKVCGNGNAFNRVKENLTRLVSEGIHISLQMTLTKDNITDLVAVNEFAKELNVNFAFDKSLAAFRNCSEKTRDEYSVNETDYINTVSQLCIDHQNTEELKREKPVHISKENVCGVGCSAGRNNAFVSFTGNMQPCLSFDGISFSLHEMTVRECWEKTVLACNQIPQIEECFSCIHWHRCYHCFAMHYNDTHDLTKPSPRLCFKRLHPEEATRIELYYLEYGKLPPIED